MALAARSRPGAASTILLNCSFSLTKLGLKLAPALDTVGAENHGVERRGVIVIGIDPTGRAADLGIEAGDIILEIGGKTVQMPSTAERKKGTHLTPATNSRHPSKGAQG
jgi:S1-C subfamily serine protease